MNQYLSDNERLILMHRDAHFGGSFAEMLAYYEKEEHLGIHPDIEEEEIYHLAEVEKEHGESLSLFLSEEERERVLLSQEAYRQLRSIYEVTREKNPLPRLMADLILGEDEEREAEIQALLDFGPSAIPELIQLIRSDNFIDPLFPGYGYAPLFAIKVLARMQAKEAIIPLFEMLGKETLFGESAAAEALVSLHAKEFLLKILASRPITRDNMQASYALSFFPEEEEIAQRALQELTDPNVVKNTLFSSYLLSLLPGLNPKFYPKLLEVKSTLAPSLKIEMEKMFPKSSM